MKTIHYSIIASALFPLAGFSAETFEKIPHLLSARMPSVSEASGEAKGDVFVKVDINENGYVTSASLKSSTAPGLEVACIRAIRDWHYEPAIKDGHAVAATFVQPIHFGADTVSTEDVTTSPTATHQVRPEISDELARITGNVTVVVHLSESGAVTSTSVGQSSHEELNAVCLDVIKQWEFSPAVKKGVKVASVVHVPFHFVGNEKAVKETAARAEVLADNHELRAVRQISPELSQDVRELGGKATIAFTVDEHGFVSNTTVKDATDARLGEAARSAMLDWKFKPVVRNGKAVAVTAVQPFNFGEGTVVAEVVDKMPKINHIVEPTLPDNLRGARGRVVVQFDVKENGEVANVQVKNSSAPEISGPVLAAAKQWTFKPAIKAGKPVDSKVIVPFLVGSAD